MALVDDTQTERQEGAPLWAGAATGLPRRWWAVLAAIGVVAAAVIAYVTGDVLGVGVDSVDFIAGAWNLLKGLGLQQASGRGDLEPMTHFPPLTSVLLAMGGWTGLDVVRWARWMTIFFFSGSAVLAAWIVLRHARSIWPAIIVAVLVIGNRDVLKNHSEVASEPPFFFLMFLTIWWLICFLENGKRKLLVIAGIAAGLSLLTRYPGAALAGAGVLCIALVGKGGGKRRLLDAVMFGLISVGPAALWSVRNVMVAGTAADREFVFHRPPGWRLHEGMLTVFHWFMPDLVKAGHPKRWLALLLMIAAMLLILAWRRRPQGTKASVGLEATLKVTVMFAALYGLVIVATVLFFDAATPLDGRILLPIYLALMLAGTVWIDRLLSFVPRRSAIWIGMMAMILVMLGGQVRATVKWNPALDPEEDLNVPPWTTSEIFRYIRTQPADVRIVTNEINSIYFFSGYLALEPPDKTNYNSYKSNPRYEDEMRAMIAMLRRKGGLIVYFDDKLVPYRWDLPSLEELKAALETREIMRTPEGVVLEVLRGL